MSGTEDVCVLCEKPADGEAEVLDPTDGQHYILRLCQNCGTAFEKEGETVSLVPRSDPSRNN